MSDHCYATRDDFIRSIGSTSALDSWRERDDDILSLLRSASSAVESYCRRTGSVATFSGFGPRVGTNVYDVTRVTSVLDLDDDLLTLTSLGTREGVAESLTTWSSGTDFLLRPGRAPYRYVVPTGETAFSIPTSLKGVEVAGTWGYSNDKTTLTATVGTGGITSGATLLPVSLVDEFSPGQTLWVETEMMLVTRVDPGRLAVVRSVNGTTAAAHNAAVAISLVKYPVDARDATLRIAVRRWKALEAGLTGDMGGVGMPVTSENDTRQERAILRSTVGHLAFERAG